MLQSVIKCDILIMYQRDTQRKGVESMVEIVSKFLDSLYETSKSCDDFSVYKFQKEWYENNGYVVLFDNGHHTVFYKAKIISSTSNRKD